MHPFSRCISELDERFTFFDINKLGSEVEGVDVRNKIRQLPLSIKILLEMILRKCDGTSSGASVKDVQNILNWKTTHDTVEVPFWPARIILQDFSGVPAVADLAAMRDRVSEIYQNQDNNNSNNNNNSMNEEETNNKRKSNDAIAAELVNPLVDVDLVIDHSINAVQHGSRGALRVNEQVEMQQNRERFELLQWASQSFRNFRIVPPGSGIVHQINLELLARVVFTAQDPNNNNSNKKKLLLYPDTLVGTDSHTTMVNGIGVVGWGVGGIEAEAAMLGEPLQMLLPSVIGVRLIGALPAVCTATDLVLLVVQVLRKANVVGKFVEFFGPGVASLSAADRATISNMCPEYGATCALFAVDDETLKYLAQTGRSQEELEKISLYAKRGPFASHDAEAVSYSRLLHMDLSTEVTPSIAGPKRPQDRIPLSTLKSDFATCLGASKPGHKSFYSAAMKIQPERPSISFHGQAVNHGMVVLAAITSCTNTSNPEVMIGAGLLARNARKLGLKVPAFVKTSLSPGSRVVTAYLEQSGLLSELEALGFFIAGYGCMTCIGNSGPLVEGVSEFVRENKLVANAVLSGNRNFEGRVHPDTLGNYLASPPLVVAFAIAGTVNIDFETQPLISGGNVFLKDIWPDKREIHSLMNNHVSREAFEGIYAGGKVEAPIWKGNETWQTQLATSSSSASATAAAAAASGGGSSISAEEALERIARFRWDSKSTYLQPPPFFHETSSSSSSSSPSSFQITGARCLLYLGDSVTTDHISPAGSIATNSDSGLYLAKNGISVKDFNSYGSRRGNDLVMVRGTFANLRLANKLVSSGGATGPRTLHLPSKDVMSVFDAAERYRSEGGGNGTPLVVVAGKEYGSGSSRDWAAKGPALLGVKVVIAESYERIHRSNLVGMGILPLQFQPGESAAKLGLTGHEVFSFSAAPSSSSSSSSNLVQVSTDSGISFQALKRVDTAAEAQYMTVGGILPFVVNRLVQKYQRQQQQRASKI